MLNIDELIGEKKVIVYGGREYEVKEVTLELTLEVDKKLKTATDENMLETMSEVIEKLVPDLPIKTMSIKALKPMFDYILDVEEKKDQTGKAKK
ncbi:MAG: hypothetical protein RR203_02480 [Synergistaceae bacterium]